MKSKISLVLCIMILAVVSGMDQARADGDGATRPATAAEKSFYGKVLKTIDSALPQGPANWDVTTKPSVEPPKNVYENGSFGLKYTGSWFDRSQKPDPSAGMKSHEQNSQAFQVAMQEMMQASQSGDKAGYEAAQVKMMAAMGKSQKITASQKQAPNKASINDACLQVEVSINNSAIGLKKAVPLDVKGVTTAFMLDDGDTANKDCPYGQGVVLLGSFGDADRGGEYTYFRTKLRQDLPYPKVENMVIKVRASEERVREYLGSVKWDKLNALPAK